MNLRMKFDSGVGPACLSLFLRLNKLVFTFSDFQPQRLNFQIVSQLLKLASLNHKEFAEPETSHFTLINKLYDSMILLSQRKAVVHAVSSHQLPQTRNSNNLQSRITKLDSLHPQACQSLFFSQLV